MSADAWEPFVATLDARLARAFAALVRWCGEDPALLERRPGPDEWTPREVLEHVTLANRYLLFLVEKLRARGLRRAARGLAPPPAPAPTAQLEALARHEHRWRHPAHMTPSGALVPAELAQRLAEQAATCRAALAAAPRGEGALHAIRMSAVPGPYQRLDLYQYLTIVALHAERHLRQLERAGRGTTRRPDLSPES